MCDHGFFTNTIRTSQASRTSNTAYAWVGTNPNDEARLSDISPVATVTKQSPYLCAFTNLCHVRCFWKLLSSKWNPSGILCCKIVHLPVQKKEKAKGSTTTWERKTHGNRGTWKHAMQTWHKHIGLIRLVLTTQSTHTNQCRNLNLENHNHHVFSCMLFQWSIPTIHF